MSQVDQATLAQWEEIYKRGLLTFWILFELSECERYAYEMREAIVEISQGTIDVDDNSIYRALRRFSEAGLVQSNLRPSESGPARRYFSLTAIGQALLANFIQRNLVVFQSPQVIKRMNKVLKAHNEKGR